jgi:AraC-like DNA-binding protein
MRNVTIYPSEDCSFLIKRFLFLTAPEKCDQIEEKFIPDGCISFVFNFEGEVTVSDNTSTYILPSHFIVKPAITSLNICTHPPLDTMVVVCNASVFTRFFGVDLSKPSIKPFIDGKTLIPAIILDALKNCKNEQNRKEIIEIFVRQNLKGTYVPDEIDLVYTKIVMSKGEISVDELLKQANLNPRSFRRHFMPRAGLSAKALSRLIRVNYLWDCCLKGSKTDFQSMVYDGNYYDQSHLIHDFKKIVGEAPSHFFKKDQIKATIISGKVIR